MPAESPLHKALWYIDQDIVIQNLHGKGSHRDGGVVIVRPRAAIEFPGVPGTGQIAAIDGALSERPAAMSAGVRNSRAEHRKRIIFATTVLSIGPPTPIGASRVYIRCWPLRAVRTCQALSPQEVVRGIPAQVSIPIAGRLTCCRT